MRALFNWPTLRAVLIVIILGFIAPATPTVSDYWFEFGNAVPETLGLTKPVLFDDVIEFHTFPDERIVELTRTGSYDIEGPFTELTLIRTGGGRAVAVDFEALSFIIDDPGSYEITIDGGPVAVAVLPDRTKDIVASSIGASALLLIGYLGVRTCLARRRRRGADAALVAPRRRNAQTADRQRTVPT